jgi:transglutaminase-like putative cysteine protease
MKYRFLILLFVALIIINNTYAKEPDKRAFKFNYSFTVTDIPKEAKKVKVWVPLPQDTDYQKVSDIVLNLKGEHSINTEKVYGNKMAYMLISPDGKSSLPISISFNVNRTEIIGLESKTKNGSDMGKYLKANKLVTLSDRVKGISADLTKGKEKTLDKARAIYDYVFTKMAYDKSGTGWGRGDTEYACDVAKGNCTDFHSLFISLARAAGIPARFKIGFPLPSGKESGNIGGYHCWAEFYDEKTGWIPVDASEAKKHPEKKDYFFGNVDESRVELTVGRDLTLSPKQSGEELNFFVYPYIEVDGEAHFSFEKGFSFKNI